MRYVVFLGAPSPSSIRNDGDEVSYQWRTIGSTSTSTFINSTSSSILIEKTGTDAEKFPLDPSPVPRGTSRRISSMYDNIIFGGEEEDEGDSQLVDMRTGDQTTLITWAATTQPEDGESSEFTNRRPSLRDFSISRTRTLQQEKDHPHLETQDQSTSTTTTNTTGNSYSYSDTSSIARFPDFQFSLGALSALSLALGSVRGPPWGRGNKKVCCFLLAVLEVDGPDEVTVRRGPDTGHVVSVLRLIVGDETSTICKLTAWRQVAETWGGGIRRGDVVYFENILATATEENGSSGGGSTSHAPTFTLVASPYLHSQAEICYRTMPRTSVPADMRLRPDLRLGASDATVRRVAAVVAWFERMAGLGAQETGSN